MGQPGMLRGMLCLGVGASCLVGGLVIAGPAAAIAGPAAAAAATGSAPQMGLAALAAETLKAIGGGVLGNVTHDGLKRGIEDLSQRLHAAAEAGQLPQNHDLARALRRSQLNAFKFFVEAFWEHARNDNQSDPVYDGHAVRSFRRSAREFNAKALKEVDGSGFFRSADITGETARLEADLQHRLDGGAGGSVEAAMLWLWAECGRALFEEFCVSEETVLPAAFMEWSDDLFGEGGFGIVAQQFFAECLKTDERLRTIVFLGRFDAIDSRLTAALLTLRNIDASHQTLGATLTARFNLLEEKLAAHDLADPSMLREALVSALTDPQFGDEIERIIGVYRPHDDWIGSLTSVDVAARIDSLCYSDVGGQRSPSFFGRDALLGDLDQWLESSARGVCVVCAPSGGGKSALLARWCSRRQGLGDRVARHFASIRFPSTTAPAAALQHLLAQIREIDRADPNNREARIPSDEMELLNAIHARLRQPAPEGRRLVVAIDALDELDFALRDIFARPDLGDGNFIIVSSRAEPGVTPPELDRWLKASVGSRQATSRIDVPALSPEDVAVWLEASHAGLLDGEIGELASQIIEAGDGLPLFIKHIVALLAEAHASGATALTNERAAITAKAPAPFEAVLREAIDGSTHGPADASMPPFSLSERAFLSVLTQVKGPISEQELRSCFERMRKDNSELSLAALPELRRGVARWLTQRAAPVGAPDRSPRMSFDHPRLAREFAQALGPDLSNRALEALLSWCSDAWRSQKSASSGRVRRGADYALRQLPAHLLDLGKMEVAAKLLIDADFVGERFTSFHALTAAETMHRSNCAKDDRVRRSTLYTTTTSMRPALMSSSNLRRAGRSIEPPE